MSIDVKNVTKIYKPQCVGIRGLFGMRSKITALSDISFNIKKGESVGIIGSNGSGKSTLLKLLCSVSSPTSGEINIDGRISALLELGTGFNPEYTGISNIYLYGAVIGLSKQETKVLIPEICAFADIGDFIYKPIKTYSDGMFLRLAFACAVSVTPDILIIDEALSVGDFRFRQKCFNKIKGMKKSGTTVITVSHDIDILRRLCDRAIWIENGKIKKDGGIRDVSSAYMEYVTENSCCTVNLSDKTQKSYINRFGSHIGSIKNFEISTVQRTNTSQTITVNLDIQKETDINNAALSVSIKDSSGLDLTVISTYDNDVQLVCGEKNSIEISYICNLCPGRYSISIAFEDRSETPIKYYDYIESAAVIEVVSEKEYFGLFSTNADFKIKQEQ